MAYAFGEYAGRIIVYLIFLLPFAYLAKGIANLFGKPIAYLQAWKAMSIGVIAVMVLALGVAYLRLPPSPILVAVLAVTALAVLTLAFSRYALSLEGETYNLRQSFVIGTLPTILLVIVAGTILPVN